MPRKPDPITPVQMSMKDKHTAEAINAAVDEMIAWILGFGKDRPISQLKRTDLINLAFAATSAWVLKRVEQQELADTLDDPLPF